VIRVITSIDVDDLERGVAFYTRGLDLREQRRLFDGTAVEMAGASTLIYLLSKPAGTRPVPAGSTLRDYSRHWTPVHLDFVVPDLAAAVDRAVAAGATLEDGIRSHDGWREAALADPFGHGFCLLEGWPP
jgi:catechol 2,3-dioxygenase-like lactoylglutathione lyase family enzyme